MKNKVLIIMLVAMATLPVHAQTNFGIGLQKELFGVSLNAENADDATFCVDKVDAAVLLKDHLRIGLGFQSGTLVEH